MMTRTTSITNKYINAYHNTVNDVKNIFDQEGLGLKALYINDELDLNNENYDDSKALKKYAEEAGTWQDENLDRWLENPKKMVRKTKMIFPGLKKADERANIIAYMKSMGN